MGYTPSSTFVTYVAAPSGDTTGVTDNAAVAAARADAGVGGRLIFRPGTYWGTFIQSVAGQTWELSPGTVLKLPNGSSANVIGITAANTTICGLGTIDGNRTNAGSSSAVTIFNGTLAATGTRVYDITIKNSLGYGIWLQASGCEVRHVTLSGCALAPVIIQNITGNTLTNARITDCVVDLSAEASSYNNSALVVYGTAANPITDFVVANNTVIMPINPTTTNCSGINTSYCANGSVVGNSVVGSALGITVAGASKVAVTGNSVFGVAVQSGQCGGIELSNAPYCAVSGNVIDGNLVTTDGIWLSHSGSTDVAITGNTVVNCTGRSISVTSGCDGASITGNVVRTSAGGGVFGISTGSSHAAIVGNQLDGIGTGFKGIGIEALTVGITDVVIAANRINGWTYAIELNAAATFVIARILIDGNHLQSCTNTAPFVTGAGSAGNVVARNNFGYNPVGVVTPAVPPSASPVTNVFYDRTFYVTNGASSNTFAISNGPTITLASGAFGTIRVPAGQSLTPTYTSAPTWVVEGE